MLKNKKKQIIFFFISMTLLILIYWQSASKIEIFKVQNLEVTTDYEILHNLDIVEIKDGEIEFSGWALRLNSKNIGIKLVFQSTDDSTKEVISVDMGSKENIEEYFDPDWDFGSCGFSGRIKKNKLKKDVCYEVLLVLNYEEEQNVEDSVQTIQNVKKISTNRYFFNEELYWYNPIEFVDPNVTDVVIQEVIKNGIVRAYDLEEEIWIYEYDSKLYWVINFSLFGDIEQRPEIPLFLHTSQIEKLPNDNKNLDKEYDYTGHYLTEEDYLKHREDIYYIYSSSLSKNYPITSIQTGVYRNSGENKGWVWTIRFNLGTILD